MLNGAKERFRKEVCTWKKISFGTHIAGVSPDFGANYKFRTFPEPSPATRLGIYVGDGRWIFLQANFTLKEKQFYSPHIVTTVLPTTFCGGVDVVDAYSDFVSGPIGSFYGRGPESQRWMCPLDREFRLMDGLVASFLGSQGDVPPIGKLRRIGLISNGMRNYSVWRDQKGLCFSKATCPEEEVIGEEVLEKKVTKVTLSEKTELGFAAFEQEVRSVGGRAELQAEVRGWKQLPGDRQGENTPVNSRYQYSDFGGVECHPTGFIPLDGEGLPEKVKVFIWTLWRGKTGPVLIEIEVPQHWDGKGQIIAEGPREGDLAILGNGGVDFSSLGKVVKGPPKIPDIAFTNNVSNDLVDKGDRIAGLMVSDTETWIPTELFALWVNEKGEALGYERCFDMSEALPGGFLQQLGRKRRGVVVPGLAGLQETWRVWNAQGLRL